MHVLPPTSIAAAHRAVAGALLALVACGSEPAAAPQVELALGPLPGALLSVAVAKDGALWLAGADAHDGRGGYLARRPAGADTFERVDLRPLDDGGGALWWVHARADGGVLVAGERGRLFAVDDAGAHRVATGTSATLYGVAGLGPRAYAVGGPPATLLAVDPIGARAEVLALPADVPPEARLFKVFAAADGRFHVVGERGVHLVVAGDVVTSAPVPGGPRLITVHGPSAGARPLVAVGGDVEGYALEIDGDRFRQIPAPLAPPLNGVCVGRRRTLAVGFLGTVLERDGDAWRALDGVDPGFDAHAVVIDEADVAWVVGGHLIDASLGGGQLWRIGPRADPAAPYAVHDLDVVAADDGDAIGDTAPAPDAASACPPLAEASGLELGQRELGCFEAYRDGGEVVVVNGPQGGSHVELAVRLPDSPAAAHVHLRASLVVAGTSIARFEVADLATERDPGAPATRMSTDVPVIFAGADPSPWVGATATLAVELEVGEAHLERALTVVIRR
ncbi:MAG: hypothetical protein U1F43_06460 [Myxococcota bacterium]